MIRELSLVSDESIKEMLRNEIASLNSELIQVKEKLNNSNKIQSDIENLIINIKQTLINFKNFYNYFDKCNDINVRRTLLNNIIENIIYDVESKSFNINFINLNMQLSSVRKSLDCNLYSSKR